MSEQEPKLDGPDLAAVVRREGYSGPITMVRADDEGSGRQSCADNDHPTGAPWRGARPQADGRGCGVNLWHEPREPCGLGG
jgi:hypothetical protein